MWMASWCVPVLMALVALPAADALLLAARVRAMAPQSLRRSRLPALQADDGDSLAAKFMAEQRRRQEEGGNAQDEEEENPSEAPFTGIREIILDESGRPRAIPKRPPPPPATTQRGEIEDLLQNPLFALGVAASVGVGVLLLAIAAADDAAF